MPDVPKDLGEALINGRCALFIGAGLSMGAGYPNWDELLSLLIERAVELSALPAGRDAELKMHLNEQKDYLLVAEELRDQMGESTFRDELATVFLEDKGRSEVHENLHKLGAACIVTTNYDKLIENAYAAEFGKAPPVYTYDKAGDVLDQLWRENFFILKAHGTVDERRSMVITRKDYRSLIYKANGYRAVLQTVFNTKSILFLGVGMRDPEIELLLGYLHDAFEGAVEKHYALMPSTNVTETVINRWRKDYSVRCIEYVPTTGHPEVGGFIDELLKLVS